jgi:hypothetical protein
MINWQGLFFTQLDGDKTTKIDEKTLHKMAKKILVMVLL